ncbi:MAG: (Fe-S)-binding protein [Rhizobiaceae bacterium]|nr:(Fe-S)-binding protein [Rhizobiaceae bacterium]MBL4696522.1 (Fe-S)-binding protein [Rhizobiaceae bacterium]MBL4732669.1 (Fe-S)-binding protein [Rhizobiaceae bacterium]
MPKSISQKPRVALFVTCLVDLFRPSVGFASVKLLEDAGCDLEVPMSQTCCGQPAWNSGDREDTKDLAKAVIKNFEGYDYIVAPSGSCAGMLKKHYPEVFAGDAIWEERVEKFAEKVYELTSFLVDVLKVEKVDAIVKADITYHDSCAGLRELGIQEQPRKLVNSIKGVKLKEMKDSDVCCGFGGMFSVKYSDISNSIVTTKTENIEAASPHMLLAGDLGCLLNMAGKLRRQESSIEVRHVAEVLAGMVDNAPIGERASKSGRP